MRKVCASVFSVSSVVTSLALAAAQQPPFRTNADLVEVDVVVQDGYGAFVSDLSPGDFEIQEEGKPQPIEQFLLQFTSRIGPTGDSPFVRGRSLDQAGPAPPDTRKRTFVVVFDTAHMSAAGFKRAQRGAATLFSQHFVDGDVGGVVINRQMANNRLTSDRRELLQAVEKAKPDTKTNARMFEERQWPRLSEAEAVRIIVNADRSVLEEAIRRGCADDPDQCRLGTVPEEVREKAIRMATTARSEAQQTTQVLRTLMSGLLDLEGRKHVVLMSEGFLADETWPLVQDAVALAARANARIYSLDTRGLDRGMSDHLAGAAPGVDDALSRLLELSDSKSDSTNSLAVDTGGFAVRNANVLDGAIAQIAADAGNYYILGYRPAAGLDGRFHRISVKVKRPGVVVRARRGYVASLRPAMIPAPSPVVAQDLSPALPKQQDAQAVGDGLQTVPYVNTPAPSPTPAASPVTGVVVSPAASTAIDAASIRLRPDAVKHVDSLVTDAPADEAATRGWEAYQRGDLESARSSLAVAAATPPARPWVHYALGQAQYALRDYPAAVAAWEQVRRTTPEFEPAYFDLVDGYLQLKDYDRAVRVMRDATGRWPRDPEVFQALGVAQVWRNSLDDAVGSFERAVALAPADALGYFNLGKTLELRYRSSRRYVQQLRSWVSNETDRQNAAANYERYLAIGGPFAAAAREGLTRLEWSRK